MEAAPLHAPVRDDREARSRTPLRSATGFEQHASFGWVLVMPVTMFAMVLTAIGLTMIAR